VGKGLEGAGCMGCRVGAREAMGITGLESIASSLCKPRRFTV